MPEIAQIELKAAQEVARTVPIEQASNGIGYGSFGDTQLAAADLQRMVEAVPPAIAAALLRKRYYFVPLTLGGSYPAEISDSAFFEIDSSKLMIAADSSTELSDTAVCHRNANIDGTDCIFISTRLMQDRFALSFEFYINAGHHFVDAAGVPESFMQMVWSQAEANVRGETSQDAWEHRAKALGSNNVQISAPQAKRRRPKFWTGKPTQEPAIKAAPSTKKRAHSILKPRFPTPSPFIFFRSLSISTIASCASANIRYWPHRHWLSVCVMSRSFFLHPQAMSFPSSTAAIGKDFLSRVCGFATSAAVNDRIGA